MGDKVCAMLSEGMTLREVSRQKDMPPESTVRLWALNNAGSDEDGYEGFAAQYARAREIGYHAMADELMEIADDGANDWMERNGQESEGWQVNGECIQRSRLRVDTRKWMLSKTLPKIYGDKQEIKHDVTDPMQELLSFVASNGKRVGD